MRDSTSTNKAEYVNLKYDRTSLFELSMVHSMMLVLALHRKCLGNAEIELLLTPVL